MCAHVWWLLTQAAPAPAPCLQLPPSSPAGWTRQHHLPSWASQLPMANASSRRLSALRTHLTPHPSRSDSPAPAVAAQQASADADPDDAPPSIQDMFDMSGRVAIVTGGGTHLGLAMATTLLELGAVVVLASRRVELCEEEAAKLREGGQGYRCYAARCDVTVEEDPLPNTSFAHWKGCR